MYIFVVSVKIVKRIVDVFTDGKFFAINLYMSAIF